METDTVLPYASLTKVFTSTIVTTRTQQGTIDANASIHDLLHLDGHELNQPHLWREITVLQLLQHRGGFRRETSGDPMFWPQPPCPRNLKRLRSVPVDFQPGTNYAYSNLGYCLLGLLVENADARGFEDILTREIIEPLHLLSIHILSTPEAELASSLFFSSGTEREAFKALNWRALKAVGAAAGTARDFGIFLHTLATPGSRLDGPGKLLLAPTPNCNDSLWRSCHGLAFYSHREPGSKRMFWRDGSLPGITAFAAVTSDGDVLVLLANSRDPQRWMSIHDDLGTIVYRHLGRAETATRPSL